MWQFSKPRNRMNRATLCWIVQNLPMHNLTYTHTSTPQSQNCLNCSVAKKLFSEGMIGIPNSSWHSSLLRKSLFHHETPTICRRVPVHHDTPQSKCLRGIYFEQAIISEISLISLHSFHVNPGLATNKLHSLSHL